MAWKLNSIAVQNYRPFKKAVFTLKPLLILVGANGSGKSSFFEFLRFLRDSAYQELPAEIVSGSIGQQIFHIPGPEKFFWTAEIDTNQRISLVYEGEMIGPVGRPHFSSVVVRTAAPLSSRFKDAYIFMDVRGQVGYVQEKGKLRKQDIDIKRPNQSPLSIMTNPALDTLYNLREYICAWRFYSSFKIANDKIRKSVPIEQDPVLHEDCGNLSSVLHFLITEHRQRFDELEHFLYLTVPGFVGLSVKARGGPGEVIAFWQERGVDRELSLADLADGILRLICWAVLCVHPDPPPLICIDEPDQGVHPRTLPPLAGLFQKASEKTQILAATHASYFLTQFELEDIAVMRKENGEASFILPADSAALRENLEDFGREEFLEQCGEISTLIRQ